MLTYYAPIKNADNLTLSVDNVVIDFYIGHPAAREALTTFLNRFSIQYDVNVSHWSNLKLGNFREQFIVQHQDGTSFWFGAVLNGKKPEWGRVRLDFNPNKVAQHVAFQSLLSFLVENTRPMHRTVKRFDFAIDIPVDRFSVFLVKDARAYIERRHGQEWTQYLGAKSSTVGRVKLYNKTIEAKLDYPLTRLEITLDPKTPFEKIPWPTVYILRTAQMSIDELKATETERFILSAILAGFGSPDQLGRKMREKITQLLESYVDCVKISPQNYTSILYQLRQYTQGRISSDNLVLDQSPRPRSLLPSWVLDAENEVIEKLPTQGENQSAQ